MRPSILGNGFVARRLLLIFRFSDFEYSAGSGVKRVDCVLFVFMVRLLFFAQMVIMSMYGCNIVSAVLKFGCVAVMVISSA